MVFHAAAFDAGRYPDRRGRCRAVPSLAYARSKFLITPTLQLWFEPGIWTPERTLDFVCFLTDALGKSHPSLTEWKDLRQGPKDVAVSLTERDAILARINRKIDRNRASYPGLPYVESAELNVTNALTPSAWQKPGCATLFFKPWNGLMTLEVCDADESLGAALARQVFLSACRTAISMAPSPLLRLISRARMATGR